MLIIFKKISYLILLNICIFNNSVNASFISFFKNIFSKNNNTEQVFDKNNKPIELRIQVNSSILEQIKEINNIINDSQNNNNEIKDNNFDTIKTKQQQILGVLDKYIYNRDVFYEYIINIKSIISVINFYNNLYKKKNDFNNLLTELNDIFKDVTIDKLYKQFNKVLDIINLIKLIFSDRSSDDLINKMLLLDNTVGLNENQIKEILNKCIYQIRIILDKDIVEYYNNILLEVNTKVRTKKLVLPSQLLFMLFWHIRGELYNTNINLNKAYIFFKNKVTLINQKLDYLNSYMKDKVKLLENNSANNNEIVIVTDINNSIRELKRNNNDIFDEIDRIKYVINSIIESLDNFKSYSPDEKILSIIEQEKIKQSEEKQKNNTPRKSLKSEEVEQLSDVQIDNKQEQSSNYQIETTKSKKLNTQINIKAEDIQNNSEQINNNQITVNNKTKEVKYITDNKSIKNKDTKLLDSKHDNKKVKLLNSKDNLQDNKNNKENIKT